MWYATGHETENNTRGTSIVIPFTNAGNDEILSFTDQQRIVCVVRYNLFAKLIELILANFKSYVQRIYKNTGK